MKTRPKLIEMKCSYKFIPLHRGIPDLSRPIRHEVAARNGSSAFSHSLGLRTDKAALTAKRKGRPVGRPLVSISSPRLPNDCRRTSSHVSVGEAHRCAHRGSTVPNHGYPMRTSTCSGVEGDKGCRTPSANHLAHHGFTFKFASAIRGEPPSVCLTVDDEVCRLATRCAKHANLVNRPSTTLNAKSHR